MINLEIKTKLSPPEICRRLKNFFGQEGVGLKLTEETQSCLFFEGGGGYVNASICTEENQNTLLLKAMEWENQAKKFAANLS